MLNFNRPLGLDLITDYIDNLRPMEADDCHYIIHLDAGGQSTLIEYMSDTFYRNRIRHFGGRERFLEYRLDGSLSQLRQVLEDIDANACYTNHFEGIIALDIAGLARFVNQTQTEVFLKALSIVRNQGYLTQKITTANFDIIPLGDYKSDVSKEHFHYYYRPRKNIMNRPVSMGGNGYYICGNHMQTVPTLYHLLTKK